MGAAVSITRLETFQTTECCVCGVVVVMPTMLFAKRKEDQKFWYCLNGHEQHFTGETEADRLKRMLDAEQKRRENAELQLSAVRKSRDNAELTARMTRGKLQALKQRVKNGVCPCCHRSFVQLARHMATKHPEYTHQEPEHQPGDPA
jgi:hypothetical protein